MSKSLNTRSVMKIHLQKPSHPKVVFFSSKSLPAACLSGRAGKDVVQECVQRCVMFNEKNWNRDTVCDGLPLSPLSLSKSGREVLKTPVPQRTPVP